jgi:hypothetical protein
MSRLHRLGGHSRPFSPSVSPPPPPLCLGHYSPSPPPSSCALTHRDEPKITRPLNATASSAATPPSPHRCPSPSPIKGPLSQMEHSHTISSSTPPLYRACIAVALSQSPTAGASPPHRYPSLGAQSTGCVTSPPPFSLLPTILPHLRVAAWMSYVELYGRSWWSVYHGPSPCHFRLENNSPSRKSLPVL